AFLVAAEPEIGAAVRTILVDDADHASGIAESQQLLAHDDDLLRRAVGLGQFLGQQHRHPEPAQQFAHWRSRTAFGEVLVVFSAEHGVSSGVLFWFWRRLAQVVRGVNVVITVIASQRVARMRAPDDRLREAIHRASSGEWIASSQVPLAMTAY